MTYAVRYYTKTGNTKRLAEAIAKGIKATLCSDKEMDGDGVSDSKQSDK